MNNDKEIMTIDISKDGGKITLDPELIIETIDFIPTFHIYLDQFEKVYIYINKKKFEINKDKLKELLLKSGLIDEVLGDE